MNYPRYIADSPNKRPTNGHCRGEARGNRLKGPPQRPSASGCSPAGYFPVIIYMLHGMLLPLAVVAEPRLLFLQTVWEKTFRH